MGLFAFESRKSGPTKKAEVECAGHRGRFRFSQKPGIISLFKHQPNRIFALLVTGAFLIFKGSVKAAEATSPTPLTAPKFVQPEISGEDDAFIATEGKATLEWTLEDAGDAGFDFVLQQSEDYSFSNPTVRYQGPDTSTFISGLPAGDFYYRVRAVSSDGVTGPWSNTLTVRVEYVSFNLVLILLVAGAIVFVATVLTVGLGHRRTARETPENV